MKLLAAAFLSLFALTAGVLRADPLPIEQQVAEAVKAEKVTVVHFWATWCPNCKAELANGAWTDFVNTHPDVNFIFVTVRDPKPGAPVLAKYGLEKQANFTHLQHPNDSRKKDEQVSSFMGIPMWWVPSTWVYKDGKLRYMLNYGELRFPMLNQMILDSTEAWKHPKGEAGAGGE